MNIKQQPLLTKLTENCIKFSYCCNVFSLHVENMHINNTRKTFNYSATLQLGNFATPFACLDNFLKYGTIFPYFSAGGVIQTCVCIPI